MARKVGGEVLPTARQAFAVVSEPIGTALQCSTVGPTFHEQRRATRKQINEHLPHGQEDMEIVAAPNAAPNANVRAQNLLYSLFALFNEILGILINKPHVDQTEYLSFSHHSKRLLL